MSSLSYHNTCLFESDIELLNDGQWLNDKLIGFMFEYYEYERFSTLASTVCLVSPEVTQFIKLTQALEEVRVFLGPLELWRKELIFFAVNNNQSLLTAGGSHWSLLIYERSTSTFHHFDSSGAINDQAANDLAKKCLPTISDGLGNEVMKFESHPDCSQQDNSFDCGIYALCFVEEILSNYQSTRTLNTAPILSNEQPLMKRPEIKNVIRTKIKESSNTSLQ